LTGGGTSNFVFGIWLLFAYTKGQSPSTIPRYVLLQYGEDPFCLQFEDPENRLAFVVEKVAKDPNLIVKLNRLDDWAQRYPDILGPRNSYFYFGPSLSPGQLAYGNTERIPMAFYLRRKKEASPSRYFNAQNGQELKWKIVSPTRMELCDSRSILAIWEKNLSGSEHDAQVTLSHTALTLITEVLTTLCLNFVALRLGWP